VPEGWAKVISNWPGSALGALSQLPIDGPAADPELHLKRQIVEEIFRVMQVAGSRSH